MKIKIKNFNGELPDYLTVGKEYELDTQYACGVADFKADNGLRTLIIVSDCPHLNGGSWEFVNEKPKD